MTTKAPNRTMQVNVSPVASAEKEDERKGTLTILNGPRPGSLIAIEGEVVVGRTEEASHPIDDDSLSRRHARFFKLMGSYYVVDLNSTNGTFVAGERITQPVALTDGTKIQLGLATVVRFGLTDPAVVLEAKRLYESTVRDRLTGAHNRHFLEERAAAEWSYAKRQSTSVSVLFVDADHFKKVNDTHGHAAGDAVLKALAASLMGSARAEDVVARYGGEEFVLLMRGGAAAVLPFAERIRSAVQALVIEHEGITIPVTVSIGVATHDVGSEAETMEALIARADAALYKAKQAGRNRVHSG